MLAKRRLGMRLCPCGLYIGCVQQCMLAVTLAGENDDVSSYVGKLASGIKHKAMWLASGFLRCFTMWLASKSCMTQCGRQI